MGETEGWAPNLSSIFVLFKYCQDFQAIVVDKHLRRVFNPVEGSFPLTGILSTPSSQDPAFSFQVVFYSAIY